MKWNEFKKECLKDPELKIKEISWGEGEKRILKNPEVAKECEKAESEFQALRKLILLRKNTKLDIESLLNRKL